MTVTIRPCNADHGHAIRYVRFVNVAHTSAGIMDGPTTQSNQEPGK